MAELAKMLHFLKSGTEQTAKAYSTVDEAGDNYVPLKIDGVACYTPIGATDDAMATNGRVIKDGSTYAIKSQAKPPYNKVTYTTAGTYTFTVPSGVTTLRCEIAGAGGGGGGGIIGTGGGGGGSGYKEFGELIVVEPNSTITVVVGAGGAGGAIGKYGSAGGNSKVANFSVAGGAGGCSDNSVVGGAGGNAGGAGGNAGGAGGAGGAIGVDDGAGGAGGAGGARGFTNTTGKDGSAGWVVIEYGGDI